MLKDLNDADRTRAAQMVALHGSLSFEEDCARLAKTGPAEHEANDLADKMKRLRTAYEELTGEEFPNS
jgi:hypothetical protein